MSPIIAATSGTLSIPERKGSQRLFTAMKVALLLANTRLGKKTSQSVVDAIVLDGNTSTKE